MKRIFRNNIVISCIVLTLFFEKLVAQSDTISTNIYGGIDEDWPEAINQTSDDGYALLCGTLSFGAGDIGEKYNF